MKQHEDKKWETVDNLVNQEILGLAESAIWTLCSPLGINDPNLPERQIWTEKVNSMVNGKMYYTDWSYIFAKKIRDGIITNSPEYNATTEAFFRKRMANATITAKECRLIGEKLRKHRDEAAKIIELYGARMNTEQIKALMNFQGLTKSVLSGFANHIGSNQWRRGYSCLLGSLPVCIELHESSSYHSTIIVEDDI